jgi:transglutaminase-like putative cysteine protease
MAKIEEPIIDESEEISGESGTHSFFVRFLAFFLSMCLILLSFEGYFYLIHPEPESVVALADVLPFVHHSPAQTFTPHDPKDIHAVIEATRDPMKQIANYIASNSCKSGDAVCQTKALFNFVRDQITYVPDPQFHDELENPLTVLKTGGADCEDMATLAAALQIAIGNEARLVFVPGHAYAQVRIPNYSDQWLNMETTCKTCKFNEIPTDTQLQEKEFVDL